jgi:hypothetical protein
VLPVTLHRRSKYSQQTCTQLQPLSTKNIISNERNYKDMKKKLLTSGRHSTDFTARETNRQQGNGQQRQPTNAKVTNSLSTIKQSIHFKCWVL